MENSGTNDTVVLDVERVVAGGAGLARDADGRVVLVEDSLPGDRVEVLLTESKERMASGHSVAVLTAGAGRVDPPCPEVAAGCGGCDLQHVAPPVQLQLKSSIVADALARIAKLRGVPIHHGRPLAASGYRTTVRCAVVDGRLGFHGRRSASVESVDGCLVAHPLVDELITSMRVGSADEVTIRVGARTGERLAVISPSVGELEAPGDLRVVGADALAAGAHAEIHEQVAGRTFRISAGSFFQARPDGAEALVAAVRRAVAPFDADADLLVDLYGGVGLFTAALDARNSVLVERSASAVADAEVNLADLGSETLRLDVHRWRPSRADVVVADPARSGLGKVGVRKVVETGASRVALVSCDPAAMARDLRLLVDAGYGVAGIEIIDMFPHTHHIEAVSTLRRAR